MAKNKLPKRLFKNPDRVSQYEVDRARRIAKAEVADKHLDVLHNIESALVEMWKSDPSIDDHAVSRALRAALDGKAPDDPVVALLFARLTAIRLHRKDVPEVVWKAALEKIHGSVRLHSSREDGDVSYLTFAEQYIL
jgi:hypothetical protein